MWIEVQDPKDQDSTNWVGKIERDEEAQGHWQFEFIRNSGNIRNAFSSQDYFNNFETLIGFLDFQKPCTIIHPFVTNQDNGSIGVYFQKFRAILKGRFSALIEDVAISDLDEKRILGINIISDSFASWLNKSHREYNGDNEQGEYNKPIEYKYQVDSLGEITHIYGISESRNIWEDKQSSYAKLSINFDEKVSAREAQRWCHQIEVLLQFLIGVATRWSKFGLKLDEEYQLDGGKIYNKFGKLTFGNTPYKSAKRLHVAECLFNEGKNSEALEGILDKFVKKRNDLTTIIGTLRHCDVMSKDIQEIFRTAMPVLENYLRKKYTNESEQLYIAQQKKFFDWVENSEDENIVEFSKKHISVVENKSPSLKELIKRLVEDINSLGFNIDEGFAKRIADLRGRMFHSSPKFAKESDFDNLYEEVKAVIALLALSAYIELGLDVTSLKDNIFRDNEIKWLLTHDTKK